MCFSSFGLKERSIKPLDKDAIVTTKIATSLAGNGKKNINWLICQINRLIGHCEPVLVGRFWNENIRLWKVFVEGKLLGRGGGHFQEPSRNMMKLRACLTYDPSRADNTLSQLWGREIDVEISTWTNPASIHALVDRKFYNAGVSEPSTTHSQRMLWHINICANKNLSSRAFCWPNVFLFHQY